MTWADLEQLAMQHNPTLAQSAANVEQARGLWQQAGLYPNPQVGYLRTDPSRSDQSKTNGIFLSQEFVTAGKLELRRATQSAEIDHLGWQQESQRMRVLNDLKIRYYEVIGAQAAVAMGEKLESVAKEGLTVAEQMFEQKAGTRPDILQARLQLNTIQVRLQEERARYGAAWKRLALMAGIPNLEPARIVGDLEADVPVLNWETEYERLLSMSPQLQAAEADAVKAGHLIRQEQAVPIPNVTLQSVVQYDSTFNSTNATTLVSVPLPLFDRNQGNIHGAIANLNTAQSERQRVALVLQDQLADSFRRYETARGETTRLRQRILPDAEENLDLVTKGFKLGEFSSLQVLNAREQYFQSNLAYIAALTELRKVVTEIEGLQLNGGLNPSAIGTAIQGGVTQQRSVLTEMQDNKSNRLLPGAIQGSSR